MKSLESDEDVGQPSGNPQNIGTSKPIPDDPPHDSSSSESTSPTITKKHSTKRRSRKRLRPFRELISSIVPEASNKFEERVKELEEEVKRHNHSSNSKEEEEEQLEIEVKTDGDQDQQNVLIRIICGKQKGQIAGIISEIEKLHLSVSSISALPFGEQVLVISVSAQMGNEFCMTANDLKKNLRVELLKFKSHV